jgi:iron complex outermembrane receptor protein
VQWKLLHTLELDVGGRYTSETKDSTMQNQANPGLVPFLTAVFPPIGFSAHQKFDNFSPQVTLTWRPTDDLMLYGSYKTGFLSGGFNHTATVTVGTTLSDLLFGPEKAKGGEVGAKFFLANHRIQINADGYYYVYNGLQVNSFNPITISQTITNAASAKVEGVELSGKWYMGQGFTFAGSGSYNDSKYSSYIGTCLPTTPSLCTVPIVNSATGMPTGQFGQNFSGTPTNFAPTWAGRVELDYRRTFGDATTLNASVGANFSSSYIVTNILLEPPHTLLDANLSLDHGKWTGAVIGRNLLNEVICTNSSARPLATAVPPELQCLVARGREVRLELTRRF